MKNPEWPLTSPTLWATFIPHLPASQAIQHAQEKGLFRCLGFFCETVKTMISFGAICWRRAWLRSPDACRRGNQFKTATGAGGVRAGGAPRGVDPDNGWLHLSSVTKREPKAACQVWHREDLETTPARWGLGGRGGQGARAPHQDPARH